MRMITCQRQNNKTVTKLVMRKSLNEKKSLNLNQSKYSNTTVKCLTIR